MSKCLIHSNLTATIVTVIIDSLSIISFADDRYVDENVNIHGIPYCNSHTGSNISAGRRSVRSWSILLSYICGTKVRIIRLVAIHRAAHSSLRHQNTQKNLGRAGSTTPTYNPHFPVTGRRTASMPAVPLQSTKTPLCCHLIVRPHRPVTHPAAHLYWMLIPLQIPLTSPSTQTRRPPFHQRLASVCELNTTHSHSQ